MRRASLALSLLALASVACAQQSGTARLGASVNAFFFADEKLRSAFGEPALTYGVNLSAISRPRANKLSFAYDIVSANRGDSRLFILPLTAGYEKQFGDRGQKLVPYARIEGGVAYYDVAIHDGGYDKSFKSYGAVGAAEVGVVLNRSIALKAKYYLFQNKGVGLSGAQFGLVYNFAGF